MKIAILTENYHKGGLDTFIINLINSWPNRDDFYLISNEEYPGLDYVYDKTNGNINLIKYKNFQKRISQKGGIFKYLAKIFKYPIFLPCYVLFFSILFRLRKFDRLIIVNGGYPGSSLCTVSVISWFISANKAKPIFSFHNLATEPTNFLAPIENFIDFLVIKYTNYFISVSNISAKSIRARKFFADCPRVSFIYNGIDDPVKNLPRDFTINIEPFSCIMLSTFEERKGHIHLLNAVKLVILEFPNFILNIYGHGTLPEINRIKNYIINNNLSNNVFINEFSTKKDLLIASSTLLVVPSQAFESFGLTVIEAMALGVPVVTTDVGGLPEVVGDTGAGFICPRESVEDFSEAIKKILRSPQLRSEMGAKGRVRYSALFTADRMAADYAALIR